MNHIMKRIRRRLARISHRLSEVSLRRAQNKALRGKLGKKKSSKVVPCELREPTSLGI